MDLHHLIILVLSLTGLVLSKRQVKVRCSSSAMKITVSNLNSKNSMVYLEKLKSYPACQAVMKSRGSSPDGSDNNMLSDAEITLPLDPENFHTCGTTKLENKITGNRIFYHRLVIEQISNQSDAINTALKSTLSESVIVKCLIPGHSSSRVRRQSNGDTVNDFPFDFPDNFTESSEELIDYSGNITARAPLPLLNIGVRQNGEFVDTALNVSPGTPLELVIYLDEVSAQVYGLLASFLRVTDNTERKQEEIIILNGCSIDPYIFANFETEDQGKSLSAKFRAFKFPDTNYVLFVGTINICVKSCIPVRISSSKCFFLSS